MDETNRTNPRPDERRKRLRFRAWHRGTREMDLVLGRFADAELPNLGERELASFEALLELPDDLLFAWISGQQSVDATHDSALFRKLRAFHRSGPR